MDGAKALMLGGNDSFTGSSGADVIQSYGGNDTLSGSVQLTGDGGKDTLNGGSGDDIFRLGSALSRSTHVDRFTDFKVADDTIQLEHSVLPKLGSTGTLASKHFVANAGGKAKDSNDFLVYETDTGKLFYDDDGSGAHAAVQIAVPGHAPTISASDIFVT